MLKKSLKIVLTCVCIMVLAVPVLFLAGCDKKGSAKDVINRTYHVSMVKRNFVDDQTILDNDLRISFSEKYFRVEYGPKTQADIYGFYEGTFEIDKNDIDLTITIYGGVFNKDNVSSDILFSHFRFEDGALNIEFINAAKDIMQYSFIVL